MKSQVLLVGLLLAMICAAAPAGAEDAACPNPTPIASMPSGSTDMHPSLSAVQAKAQALAAYDQALRDQHACLSAQKAAAEKKVSGSTDMRPH